MLDDAHLALLPDLALVDELRALVGRDPEVSRLAHAPRGTPAPEAIVTLENDAGTPVFQMVEVAVPGCPRTWKKPPCGSGSGST